MRRRVHPSHALALFAITGLLASCSASRMANMWKDPAYPRSPLANVLTVHVGKTETYRRMWEDAVVAELAANGVTATPSYSIFPTAVPDTQQVIDAVRERGYDGVVVSRRVDARDVTRYVPGYVTTVPTGPHYGFYYDYWGGYYHPAYTTIYQPGYTVTDSEVRYQIDVWTAEDGGRLVWMGTTSSVNASSYDQIRGEVSDLLVQELRMAGVVAGKGL